MTEEDGGRRALKVLNRGFEILELLSEHPGLRLTDISNELEMPKSTVHIYLETLKEKGYIVKSNSEYVVSFKSLTIGARRRSQLPLYDVAKAPMEELSDDIDDVLNVSLGIEERGMRVLLYKVEGQKSPYSDLPDGHTTHLHWVTLGKALLAMFPEEKVARIIDTHGLPRATSNTITSRAALLEELEEVRAEGYTFGDEERVEGIRSVAVPIEGNESDPYGAISISGPKSEFTEETVDDLVTKLKATANIVEIEYQNY